jgi:hypothetical protein
MFNLKYVVTGNSSYQIILTPNAYTMIYNYIIKVNTIKKNQTYYSANKTIFLDSIFNQSKFVNWTYVNVTSMSIN